VVMMVAIAVVAMVVVEGRSTGLTFEMPEHSVQCFMDQIHKNDKISLDFQVSRHHNQHSVTHLIPIHHNRVGTLPKDLTSNVRRSSMEAGLMWMCRSALRVTRYILSRAIPNTTGYSIHLA
jgi:hypothetical protein